MIIISHENRCSSKVRGNSTESLTHPPSPVFDPRGDSTGFALLSQSPTTTTTTTTTSSSFIRIVRDTRYSGTLGCANLKVSQVPEVARAAEKRTAPFRGGLEKEDKALCRVCPGVCRVHARACAKEKEGREGKKNGVGGRRACGGCCMLIVLHQVLW